MKRERINSLKATCRQENLSPEELFGINEHLYELYSALSYDSASVYIDKNIALARKMGDKKRENKAKLNKVHILSVTGLFDQAEDLLETIDTLQLSPESRIDYYYQYSDLYLFRAEFAEGTSYHDYYLDKTSYYRQLVLNKAPKTSFTYIQTLAVYEFSLNHYDKAIKLLENYLPQLRSGQRSFSIVTTTLSFFYNIKKMPEKGCLYLIMSAISDAEGGILENNSYRLLSSYLFDKGEVERAYRYLSISIDDAHQYGTRLRNAQASNLIPKIATAYQLRQDEQHKRNVSLLIGLSLLSACLIVGLFLFYQLFKRYRRINGQINLINEQLRSNNRQMELANQHLNESNQIKEEYIGRFLELNSSLIEKVEEQRKYYNRLAREHRLEKLYNELKSDQFTHDNTKRFYLNFDSAFLNIYPRFVEQVNRLLLPEAQIVVKESERLTTELRILALMRLGIHDNQKIAAILRAGLTTIYTYRSKMKAKAINRDTFEEQVKNIDAC